MPTPRRPKGMPTTASPASLYPELDDWLSVPLKEREWIAEDLSYGKLPGDEERHDELLKAGSAEVRKTQQDRATFLERNPDYTYENKQPSLTDLYIKPIGLGILDTAKDMGRIGADLLFRGKKPTLDEVFGRKPVTTSKGAISTPTPTISAPNEAIRPSLDRGGATAPMPSLEALPSTKPPINAPPEPKKPAVNKTPAKTQAVPDLVPSDLTPSGMIPTNRKRTILNPEEEEQFRAWYDKTAKAAGLNPNPNDPRHKYDYRALWRAGGDIGPDQHFDSKFKDDDHPNRFVLDGPNILDTKYNRPVPSNQFNSVATPDQKKQVEQQMVQAGQSFSLPEPSILDAYKVLPGMADIANMTEQRQAKQLMEMQRPGATSPTAGIPSMEPPQPLSLGQAFEEAGKSFARGTGNTAALVSKGVGLWARELDKQLGTDKKPDDYATFRLGQKISKWTNETFKGRPDLQKNFLLTTLFEGAGSSIPFLATGGAAAALGAGPGTTAAVTGALAGSASLVEQAPATATEKQRQLGLVLGGALGLTEGVPIAELFNRMNTYSGGLLSTSLKSGSVQAVEEAIQEAVQQVGENMVKKEVYGLLGQDLKEGVLEGAASGGIVGFLTGFMMSGKARIPATDIKGKTEPEKPQGAQATNAPPPTVPPDLGEIPAQQAKEKVKPPKVGDIVNRKVQEIADQYPMPTLETKRGAPPAKAAKRAEATAETKTTLPDVTRDTLPSLEPEAPTEQPGEKTYRFKDGSEIVKGRTQPVRKPESTPKPAVQPDSIDEDMREALDADLELLDETPEKKPGRVEPQAPPSVEEIHTLADEKGIESDNAPAFMDLTEEVTGKRHLDDLTGPERQAVADAIEEQPVPTFDQPTIPGEGRLTQTPSGRWQMQRPDGSYVTNPVTGGNEFKTAEKAKAAYENTIDLAPREETPVDFDLTEAGYPESEQYRQDLADLGIVEGEGARAAEEPPVPPSLEPAVKKPSIQVIESPGVKNRRKLDELREEFEQVEQMPVTDETRPQLQALVDKTASWPHVPGSNLALQLHKKREALKKRLAQAVPPSLEPPSPTVTARPSAFDQKAYVQHKKTLSRALKSGDPAKIIQVAKATLDEWEKTGQYPDDWSRWERAKEDAEAALRRTGKSDTIEYTVQPLRPGAPAETLTLPKEPTKKLPDIAEPGVSKGEHFAILTSPSGEEFYVAYGPDTKDRSKATAFKDQAIADSAARNRLGIGEEGYWDSEKEHFKKMREKYKGWTYRTEPASEATPPSLTPTESTVDTTTEGGTLPVTPSLEGGPNERTEQPRVDVARSPETAQTQAIPSLEEPGATEQVPARPADVNQRSTDIPRAPRAVSARSEGDAPGGDLPAERGRRVEPERDAPAVSGSTPPSGTDFVLTADYGIPSGQKTKYKANVEAIKLLKRLEADGRLATPDEQAILAKYTGWGGLPQAFQWSSEWQKEYRELQDLLTDEEYTSARASTPNAHYTDPETIRAIYTGLEHLGFKHGRVLEPGAGIGHFLGAMPPGMATRSQRTAIEKDSLSARLAKQLYQQANVREGAYEQQALPDSFFDVAVGNVPFADVRPHDAHNQELNKLHFSLHDYYFAKAVSQVRPGGLVAFITSRYTMDKVNGKLRDYLAKHADLVGAIRLPNTQFKAIANTDVTTDLIVLRRRLDGEQPGGETWAKTDTQATPDGEAVVNEYFVRHPENIMGTLSLEGSMYRDKEITVKPDGRNVQAAMIEAFRRWPATTYQARVRPVSTTPRGVLEALEASDDVKDGAYTIQNNALYVRRGNQFVPVDDATPTDLERAKGLIAIRDQVKKVLKSQLEDTGEPFMAAQRKELNRIYDRFQKKFGYINNRANKALFRDDPDYGTLQSLERNYDKKKDVAKKADIFSKRIIEYRPMATKAGTPKEAMLISLNETGRIDLDRMQALTGKPQTELVQELQGLIYQNPEGLSWEPAERYLSGNVRQKLRVAEEAAKTDKRFQPNVEALKLAIPEDLKPEQISVKLGHGWIPVDDYRDFIAHLLDIAPYGVKVNYSAAVGAYAIKANASSANVKNTKTFGTDRAPAIELLQDALASKLPTVYDKTSDDKRVVNEKETLLAREKLQAIQDEFSKWIWSDTDRATRLARQYNDAYNNIRLQEYDGSHLTLPGSNPAITFRPHQKNGVWRALQEGNTLLAHEVGAGKTYTKIAIAMEFRRLRMANKPLITVPNHLVEYWRNAFLELYPAAKVLAATKEDFKAENRRRLVGRIATGDWDAVVIAHSQMSRIPMSYESFKAFADEQIEILDGYLHELKADKGGNRNIIKEIEKAKARFESKLKARKAALESNADQGVTFEETGVDMLLVDEADLFKNLWFPTRMTRVAGLPNTESQRSYDMFLKTNYLNKLTNQRAVIFGTATPVSNSMAEVFTMQRYLQPQQLEQAGLSHFDAWARQFGNTVTSMELAADGSGYRPKTRFAEFVNVPELTQMFRRVMDVKSGEDLKLPVPKLRTGKPINVTVPASEPLKTYVASLIKRAEDLKKGRIDPRIDNMLKITGDGRNAALDVRLRVPGAPEDKNGKVAVMVNQVVEEYKKSTPVKGTQLIFLDLSTPKGEGKAKKGAEEESAPEEDVELAEEQALRGSVYQDIKRKLIKNGIPEKEIAFIHDAKTDEQKTKLFDDVNTGAIRVLIGSTEKMGAGTNVQKKMVALHNLDAPWRPRDIHQRNGRGIRQGNELYEADPDGFEFAVFNYATEAPSFDVYMWQTLESKARTITQIMKGDPNIRTIQDVDTAVMSFAEMKAVASGNPMVLERANKDIELRKLGMLRAAYQDTQRQLAYELKAIPSKIEFERSHLDGIDGLAALIEPAEPFRIKLDKLYEDKTEAGEAILRMGQDALTANPHRDQILTYPDVGTYRGLSLNLFVNVDGSIYFKLGAGSLLRTTDFRVEEVKPQNVMVRFDNTIAGIDTFAASIKKRIEALEKKREDIIAEQKKPFEHDEKIKALESRIKQIDTALDLTKRDENVIAEEGNGLLDILKSERGSIPANPFARTGAGTQADADRYRQQRAQEEIGFQSADPEIERRVRAAKQGQKPDTLRTRLKDNLAHVWRLVSREFEHLPDTAQFSRLRNDLLKLQKYKGIAADEIQRELAAIIKPLNRKQYDQFEWKALLADLQHEAEAGRSLPFGYTPEKVEDDLESLDAAIARDPAVQQAWQKRQQLWKRIKGDYKTSMEAIGFDVSKKLTKDDYFRHQVLEHSREKALKGAGSKIRTPTGRGFLKSRHGSTMDINANYVQAEFEVMAQMVYDTQLAKVIRGVDQTLNIRKSLEAEAKTQNNEALQAIIDKGDDRSILVDGTLKHFRQRLGMHMGRIRKAMNLLPDERLSLPQIAEIAEDLEHEANLSARGVFKVINERKAFVDHLLGESKVEWTDLIPETHDLWQPREGNIFYMADSVPANLAKALQESMLEETGLLAEKLRKVLAMGAPREQYVIPKEAKETLDQLSHKEHSWFVETNRHLVKHWKTLMLTAPRRVTRYILRNTTGDLDAMFVGNPDAFKKLPRAAKELIPAIFKDDVLTGEVKEWVKRGGYGTTMSMSELGDLNSLKAFQVTLDRASKGGVLSIPLKVWKGYWQGARMSVDYMEAMRRYATYLSYLEQMQENSGVPKNFGASRKETVMALPDIRDRAFKLSNELLGAYDRVSVAGQTIRDFWVLFYSWWEVNATRYGRLAANALDGGHGGRVLGKGALITGKNAAAFLIKASFFWSTLQAWNYLIFGDDEEELKQTNPTVANRPHILFGRNDKGEIQYLAGVGALGDLLSWVGLDEFPGLVGDLMHDRITIGEAIKNSAKAPVNRIWQGLTPAVKLPVELATRQTSYPDVFHWRPIQDRAEYLGYQTTLGPEIKALMGKPGKPLYDAEDLAGLVVQRTDPAAAAYYSWQTTERKYLERMGKDSPSVFWRSPRGEALHNWSLALKHKDQEAEAAWRDRYIELEKEKHGRRFSETMMYKDIEKSLRAKAPLAGVSKEDRDAILSKLDADELRTLKRAEDYYRDTMMNILPSVRRQPFQRKLQSQGWLTKRPFPLPASLEP